MYNSSWEEVQNYDLPLCVTSIVARCFVVLQVGKTLEI